MTKIFGRLAVIGLCITTLSACQTWNTARIKQVKETEQSKSNALIYCAGTDNCEFERLNTVTIVDAEKHRVTRAAIQEGLVRLQESSLNKSNALYLSVPPKQHKLVIRFYPISKDRAEKLHVIHKFNAKQKYTFRMYRDRSRSKGSLLNVSAPDPLCVDLVQNSTTIRRFCKPYNVLNGLGEFVEQKI